MIASRLMCRVCVCVGRGDVLPFRPMGHLMKNYRIGGHCHLHPNAPISQWACFHNKKSLHCSCVHLLFAFQPREYFFQILRPIAKIKENFVPFSFPLPLLFHNFEISLRNSFSPLFTAHSILHYFFNFEPKMWQDKIL